MKISLGKGTSLKERIVLTTLLVRWTFSESVFLVCGVVNHVEAYLIEDRLFYSILVAAFLTYSLASKVKREFFFKYDDDLQREDTKAIVNNWIDL